MREEAYNRPQENLWFQDEVPDYMLPEGTRRFVIPVGNKSSEEAKTMLQSMMATYAFPDKEEPVELTLIDREFPGWRNLSLKTGFVTVVNSLLTRIKELERQVEKNKRI